MGFNANGNRRRVKAANDQARSRVTYVPRRGWKMAWALAAVLWAIILVGLFFLIRPVDALERCQQIHSADTCIHALR